MDNQEHREATPWIEACSTVLAPPTNWEPDFQLARARFEVRAAARLHRRSRAKRYFLIGAVASLLACIAVPAIPQTRELAQQIGDGGRLRLEQLWYWFTVVRGGPVLLVRLNEAIRSLQIRRTLQTDGPYAAASASEAAKLTGFVPRLPDPGVVSGSPRLSVFGPTSSRAVLTGNFAAQWDGAQLTLQMGAIVIASWPHVSDDRGGGAAWADLTLAQGPAAVTAPPGFDLEAFAATQLRAAGMRNRDMISQLSRRPTTVPALLYGYLTPYRFTGVRQVNLHRGPATVIEEFGPTGENDDMPRVERLTLLWSAQGRLYVLSGRTEAAPGMMSTKLAAALASVIDVANTIE